MTRKMILIGKSIFVLAASLLGGYGGARMLPSSTEYVQRYLTGYAYVDIDSLVLKGCSHGLVTTLVGALYVIGCRKASWAVSLGAGVIGLVTSLAKLNGLIELDRWTLKIPYGNSAHVVAVAMSAVWALQFLFAGLIIAFIERQHEKPAAR